MREKSKKELYNLRYFIRSITKASPIYVVNSAIESILEAALPFIGIILPKFIIDELQGAKRIGVLAFYVFMATITAFILSLIINALKRQMKVQVQNIAVKFEEEIGSHNMKVAYENLEDTKYIELKNRAMMPVRERMTLLFMVRYLPDMARYSVIAIGAMGIIIKFDFVSLIVIVIPTFLITYLNKNYQKKDLQIQKEWVNVERSFMYYYNLMSDFSSSKDIRLFDLNPLLMSRNNECDDMILGFKQKSGKLRFRFEGMSKVLEGFTRAFVYGYIGIKALMRHIGIGSVTMYIEASNTFFTSVTKLLEDIVTLRQDCRYLDDYVKLEEMPVEEEKGGIKELDFNHVSIEFEHVSFHYPGSSTEVLKDVSFCIEPNESISIVGSNGAGKTTIIKLLTRLFQPSKGTIYMNGIDIQTIDATTYKKIISVVFQDFKIFQLSIADNITAGQEVDEKQLNYALTTAGIMEKIDTLPKGTNTYVGKQFDPDGSEFSGGELQKLAIARSLYKNSPIIALDEPTAALDPFAEEEVYQRFHRLTNGRTTVYISHRLSSCKFCNRIIFLDGGKIVEDGNHEELMKLDGKYAQMFNVQASQYIA